MTEELIYTEPAAEITIDAVKVQSMLTGQQGVDFLKVHTHLGHIPGLSRIVAGGLNTPSG